MFVTFGQMSIAISNGRFSYTEDCDDMENIHVGKWMCVCASYDYFNDTNNKYRLDGLKG